jgi:hypothetical protein
MSLTMENKELYKIVIAHRELFPMIIVHYIRKGQPYLQAIFIEDDSRKINQK